LIYNIIVPLIEGSIVSNLLKYITFRAVSASVTSLIISFILGPYIIKMLKKHRIEDNVREYSPDSHKHKKGTPTMGGILIILSILIPSLLWADLFNKYVLIMISGIVLAGVLGFVDDMMKLKKNKGIRTRVKFLTQIIISLILGVWVVYAHLKPGYETLTNILFIKNLFINLGVFYIPFIMVVIIGSSNAVNLTDGLDGLAVGIFAIAISSFIVLSYILGNVNFSRYLNLLYLPGSGELAIILSSTVGASLGFLWFNAPPAEIFMGDTGSLTLGTILGLSAVLLKQEVLLIIIGGMFVLETSSVLIQVIGYKITGKRIFKIAPLHHHFEAKGWTETKIVIRFWIIEILFVLFALSTLKIR